MIKIGLIGCGFMGTMHANCYKNIEGVKVVAVADLRREKAEQIADGEIRKIEIEKKQLSGGYKGGNISDLGGYYNELVYFTDRIKAGEKIEKATLESASASLEFVLAEIASA
jgi:hypothetical protein